jgi:hypothetical protein
VCIANLLYGILVVVQEFYQRRGRPSAKRDDRRSHHRAMAPAIDTACDDAVEQLWSSVTGKLTRTVSGSCIISDRHISSACHWYVLVILVTGI